MADGSRDPLDQLIDLIERFAAGAWSARSGAAASGSLGRLAAALDRMAAAMEIREAERKELDAALRFTGYSVDRVPVSILWMGKDGRFVRVNEHACRALGYTREELMQLRVPDIDPNFSAERWAAHWPSASRQEHRHFETLHRAKDGRVYPVEITGGFVEFEGNTYLCSVAQDISERKQAEEALRQSETKYRTLIENFGHDYILYSHDVNHRYLYMSPSVQSLLGYSPEEVYALESPPYTDHPDNQIARTLTEQAIQGHPTPSYRVQLYRRDGCPRWLEVSEVPVFDGHGNVVAIEGVSRDITEQLEANERLKESERTYREIFNATDEVIFILDPQTGLILDVNEAVGTVFGHGRAEVLSWPLEAIFPTDPPAAETGRALQTGSVREWVGRRKDGSTVFCEVAVRQAEIGGQARRLAVVRDVSERKRSEEALRQAQKLESIGLLAGGIAHDFNNLLTAIIGNLDLASIGVDAGEDPRPYIEAAAGTTMKAAELTRQILAYSGRGRFVVELQDLNRVVQEILTLLSVSISKKVELVLDLSPELPAIMADTAQLQQVVLNLVTNASDAIGDQPGQIRIRTHAVELDDSLLQSTFPTEALAPGLYSVLEVADTGCGISPEVMDRIFDPFFSTKPKGRGLGLSAMLGILRGHGAGLKIYSEVQRGSVFKVFFPASGQHPRASESTKRTRTMFHGIVLLADDEPIVLDFASSALRSMGFEVIQARDGEEALARFREWQDRLALVLLDITMPKVDGRQACLVMLEARPCLPVILSSGYSEQDVFEGLQGRGRVRFIQKPYRIVELRELIQHTLGD